MVHPFLENTTKTIQYTLLWLGYALVQTCVLYSIVELPLWILVVDALLHALIYGVLGVLLWSVVRYGNYAVLSSYQQLINYVALAFLTLALWMGIGYAFFYWFFDNTVVIQLTLIHPIRAFIGILIYLLIIQSFSFTLQQTPKIKEQETFEENKPTNFPKEDVLERIAVKSGTKIHVVSVSEILFLQADGDYVQIISSSGKYLKEQTMKFFEEHLPNHQFVRVHRSVIVNVEMISRIELYEKQNQVLTLKNGDQIKTSPAGYKNLRSVLNL